MTAVRSARNKPGARSRAHVAALWPAGRDAVSVGAQRQRAAHALVLMIAYLADAAAAPSAQNLIPLVAGLLSCRFSVLGDSPPVCRRDGQRLADPSDQAARDPGDGGGRRRRYARRRPAVLAPPAELRFRPRVKRTPHQSAWAGRNKARARLLGSATHSRTTASISHRIEGGGTPAQPATRSPARRNSSTARGKWARSLTSRTTRPPRGRSNRALSRAFSMVSRDPGSTRSAASGTPRASAIRRMISASGTGPLPPPESSNNGAAPARNSWIPRSSRLVNPAEPRQPSTTTASAPPLPGRLVVVSNGVGTLDPIRKCECGNSVSRFPDYFFGDSRAQRLVYPGPGIIAQGRTALTGGR